MNLNRNSYNHIKSFGDFENEKMKLYFQIRLSEKKLELRYIELVSFLNPMRFVPFLVNSWLAPIATSIKNLIIGFFTNKEASCESKPEENDQKSDSI
ncbi:hypothetical protein J1N10_19225 [Carboxylicivirga sp. A043]|uniref:hypothetical protein n=1 Tax=Carboxylicivirga litoralis TaxID=2816963 RepID=UPI0021CAF4E1|nr:hypothetical protein [Carboxylicivirga sp. A043]MCU4158115.1 hypothetical protein [Carboxylicivirga sp. A043]